MTAAPRASSPGPSWARSVARAWGTTPVVLPADAPIDLDRAFATLVARAEPFRAGTRVESRSPVRFRTGRGRLAAPGGLLPTTEDTGLHGYADRLAREQPGTGWLLTAGNPFQADFTAWALLRDRLGELWREVGWPSVPVTVELAAGDGHHQAAAPAAGHAVLTWVLHGRLHTTAGTTGASGQEVRAGAGDFAYRPAGQPVTETWADRCAVLRVTVPTDPRAAFTVVRDTLRDAIGPAESAHPLPYLPCPPAPVRDDPATGPEAAGPDAAAPAAGPAALPPAAPLREIADTVRGALTAPEFTRLLRHAWAARRSAAGLEPAPPPGPPSTLDYGQRLRVAAEIVTMPDGPRGTVWAVNGHLLPVGGAAAARILAALPPGGETEAGEVCRRAGAGTRNDGVLRLLRALHRLRGIEVLEDSRA